MTNKQRGYVYTHPEATRQELTALLEAATEWAYVAGLAAAELVVSTPELPRDWPEGRAFGPPCELRWQRLPDGDHYRLEFLTEDPELAPSQAGWQPTASDVDGVSERRILLWGEMSRERKVAPPWIEVRIPQPLVYPLDPERDLEIPAEPEKRPDLLRVVIQGLDYTAGGVPVTTRWQRITQQNAAPLKE